MRSTPRPNMWGDNARFLEGSFQDLGPVLGAAESLVKALEAGEDPTELGAELRTALEEADIEFLTEEIPKAIEQSLAGIERVRKIVQSMREFSHPGVEDMTSIDLNRAIESTITVASNEWKYVAELETCLDPDLPPVTCFAGEINQVVLNMIVNGSHAISDATEGTSDQMGKITISTSRVEGWAEIRIADTGHGIPAAVQSKIFNPFFTTKEVGRGTGQGLSIAYGIIVKTHGGTLDFETEVGVGTTFIIRLPLEQTAAVEESYA